MSLKRREFIKKSAMVSAGATLAATATGAIAADEKPHAGKKALFVYGGWDGHQPMQCRDLFVPWLREEGFEVEVSDTLDSYLDADLMGSRDLIIQIFTMSEISNEQLKGLLIELENKPQ